VYIYVYMYCVCVCVCVYPSVRVCVSGMGLVLYGLDVLNNIIALKGSVPGHAESVSVLGLF
jgi:hypothetical protein